MTFKERIRELRKEAKWTQVKAAKRCRLYVGNLRQYEYGQLDNPSLDTFRKFARGYGLTVSELLKGVK